MAGRSQGPFLDPRLATRVPATRRAVAVSVAVGLGLTAAIVVQAVLIAHVVDRAMLHHADLHAVTPQLIGLAGAFAARALLGWAGEVSAHRTAAGVTSTLRRQLLGRAVALGPVWLSGERAGELSLTATRGVDALDTYFGRFLPQAALGVLAPLGIVVWVATQDWLSALLLVVLVALVPLSMVWAGRRAAEATEREWRRLSSLSAHLLELITGLATLRAFGRQAQGRREVAEATEGLRRSTMATLRTAFLSAFSMELLSGLGVGLVAMALGLRLLGGTLGFATALAVLLVSPEVFLPVRRAGAEFHASAEGREAAARILAVLDTPPPAPAGTATPTFTGPGLVVRDLVAAYPGRPGAVAGPCSFEVGPGHHVALTGPSGGGKSTLLSVLLGFLAPAGGTVLVDGVPLADLDPRAWRRLVAWVPQHPHLFAGTLADNLRLGAPGAGDDDLRQAVDQVGLGSWLRALPDGLGTAVGDGGMDVSPGERQRLALARARLTGAPLVLLDEPTAHLDEQTVAELRASLDPWLADRAVLVAGHRPDDLCRLDEVVTLVAPDRAAAAAGSAP